MWFFVARVKVGEGVNMWSGTRSLYWTGEAVHVVHHSVSGVRTRKTSGINSSNSSFFNVFPFF